MTIETPLPVEGVDFDSPLTEAEERERDEVVKRMIATPPEPKKSKDKKVRKA
jgi:hypothetical protein